MGCVKKVERRVWDVWDVLYLCKRIRMRWREGRMRDYDID